MIRRLFPATFLMILACAGNSPPTPSTSMVVQESPPDQSAPTRPRCITIATDDTTMVNLLKTFLREDGFAIREVNTDLYTFMTDWRQGIWPGKHWRFEDREWVKEKETGWEQRVGVKVIQSSAGQELCFTVWKRSGKYMRLTLAEYPRTEVGVLDRFRFYVEKNGYEWTRTN